MHIHLLDYSDRNVRMILPPTADGVASVVHTYTVSGLTYPTGATFDGKHIHLLDNWTDNVRMILPPTADGIASVVHTYSVSGLTDLQGATFDGQYLHLLDYSDANVRMILPPTADGVASVVHTYSVSGLTNRTGATFDGKHIHLLDNSNDNVRMILPPTADGIAPVVHTYTVSGLNNLQGATFDGKHIHLLDNSDNNVRMILPPTADGVASVVHTYSVSGLTNLTGATFDGPIAPFIFASSIPNQAWIVGTAVNLTLPKATGRTGSITYSLSPTTPAGITFTPGTRVLAGNPTGLFTSATFTYTATAGTETVTITFTIVVTAVAITFSHPVTVLPHSATLLEKAFVDFYVARQEDKFEIDGEIPIRHLYDPDNCPAEFLPYLQCLMSVQEASRGEFSDTQIRQLIRDSYDQHITKGTIQSLRDVITSLGYIVNRIEEGVVSTPAVPATDWARFRIVMDTALAISAGENLEELLTGVAPVSRELVEITYDQANPYDGTVFYDGTHAYGRIIP